MLQNAIDFVLPIITHGMTNAVLLGQLGLSYDQAVAWLESLTPLFKTKRTGGLSYAILYEDYFVDIKTAWALSVANDCGAMGLGEFAPLCYC